MRKIYAAITYAAALSLTPQFALAGSGSSCYSIRDADARAYCLARAYKSRSKCYSIQNGDLRAACLAEADR